MKKFLFTAAVIALGFKAQAQQTQLPDNLNVALKSSVQKMDEALKANIVYYAKNNAEAPKEGAAKTANKDGGFYDRYAIDEDNLYYNTNNEPLMTNMPAPGPNLNYYHIDCGSTGNYDRVVKP